MLKEERLQQITQMLRQYGKVEVNHLSRVFGVTEITIRRDLNALEEKGVALRSHGGAFLNDKLIFTEQPYQLRAVHNRQEKEALAQAALPMLTNGQKVFFDSSTTVLALAQLTTNDHNLLVVTDTISTAMELNARSGIKVLCIGGELRKTTCSCHGYFAEQMLEGLHFDIAFFSVPRVTANGLLSTPSAAELPIKKMAMARADKVVLMVDHSKLGLPELLTQSTVKEIDILITDPLMPAPFLESCRKAGVQIIIADDQQQNTTPPQDGYSL